jgi:hypothetical protein
VVYITASEEQGRWSSAQHFFEYCDEGTVTKRAGEVSSRAGCGTVIRMVLEQREGSDIERVRWGVK